MQERGVSTNAAKDTTIDEHDYLHDDADDEDEDTHVEDGSQSQREDFSYRGYEDRQRYVYQQEHDETHEYDDRHEFNRPQAREGFCEDESSGAEGLYGYDDSHVYNDHGRHEYLDGYDEHAAPHRYEEDQHREYEAAGSQKAESERHLDEDMHGFEAGDGMREEQDGRPESRRVYVEETQVQIDTDNLPPARVELMERLCDLVQRLSSAQVGGSLEDEVLDVLNVKVDEMEELLMLAEETAEAEATADLEGQPVVEVELGPEAQMEEEPELEPQGQPETTPEVEIHIKEVDETEAEAESESPEEQANSGYDMDSRLPSDESPVIHQIPFLQVDDQDIRDMASPLPWLSTTFKYSELSLSPTHSHPELAAATNEALEAAKQAAQAQAEMAEQVASQAEQLNLELAEHLHALLIDRAECAATRILDLEQEICDLEDDILSNESELRHLRLKLRAVETCCYDIENWKADWVLVRDRMLERKKDRRERRVRLHRAGCVIKIANMDK
ncbi:hypothetical protein N0V88_000567 [Collariella sp. IMI 366227]|nr:hypothetical protein N0V88_000567 [Collariella sp. IMI 366227]